MITLPDGVADPYELLIPYDRLVKASFIPDISPDSTLELVRTLERSAANVSPIIVRSVNDQFEVIYNWAVVEASVKWLGRGREKCSVIVVACEDAAAVTLAISQYGADLKIDRIRMAVAMKAAKAEFGLTDSELAKCLHCSRSSVTNTLRLLKLTDASRAAYLGGRFNDSVAKFLCGKSPTDQSALLAKFATQALITWDDIEALSPRPQVSQPDAQAPKAEKSKDDLRFERDLSLIIGAPAEVSRTVEGGYTVKLSAYSGPELENICEHLAKLRLTSPAALVIDFKSAAQLSDFFDPLFAEDDF